MADVKLQLTGFHANLTSIHTFFLCRYLKTKGFDSKFDTREKVWRQIQQFQQVKQKNIPRNSSAC
jgi:hypothetical protein